MSGDAGRGLSGTQIRKLGKKLATSSASADDVRLLNEFRAQFLGPLVKVFRITAGLRCPNLARAGRLKNSHTIREKLARGTGGDNLNSMYDIAGVRVVLPVEGDRALQLDVVGQLEAHPAFFKTRDHFEDPSFGYRAVHVIFKLDGRPVEIQVRTALQHLWAQTNERLADVFGRQIRYGEPPTSPDEPFFVRGVASTRAEVVQFMFQLADHIFEAERSNNDEAKNDAGSELQAISEVLAAQDVDETAHSIPALNQTEDFIIVVFSRQSGTRRLHIESDEGAALRRLQELDEQFRSDSDIEIVLLAADSRAHATTTHARYFVPAKELPKPR